MSATQTSTRTDSRKVMPMTRAWATASHASHSTRTPPASRTGFAIFGHPATPLRSNHAPASTHSPPPMAQSIDSGRASRPAYQEAAHNARQAIASDTEPPWPSPFKRPHSQAPAAISASVTAANGIGEGQNNAGNRMASSTIAVMMRCLSIVGAMESGGAPAGQRHHLLRGAAEAPLARRVIGQRFVERGVIEFGPELVAEEQLGVSRLPQQEVGQAPFAAGADHQVRVGHVRQRQGPAQALFRDGLAPRRQPRRGLGNVPAPAIVEAD